MALLNGWPNTSELAALSVAALGTIFTLMKHEKQNMRQPTPRTDKAIQTGLYHEQSISIEFCRGLERELSRMKLALEVAAPWVRHIVKSEWSEDPESQLAHAKAKRELEQIEEALTCAS